MNRIKYSVKNCDGTNVAIVELDSAYEILSSAVLNGGSIVSDTLFIMQVPHDYNCEYPDRDLLNVCDHLGLHDRSVGMMTAAEVDHVFTVITEEYNGHTATAAVTAGLSNQVVAGDIIEDWNHRHDLSLRRSSALHAGTINVIIIIDIPLSDAGRVNLSIAVTEAKTAALASLGYKETGTTTDAVAIASPFGEHRTPYAGTGSDWGIAASRAVRKAVRLALIKRGDFPEGTPQEEIDRIRGAELDRGQ